MAPNNANAATAKPASTIRLWCEYSKTATSIAGNLANLAIRN